MIDFWRFSAYNIISDFVCFFRFIGVKLMEFITVKEAAVKWNLSERRLQTMCNDGVIPGVMKFGHAWAIPSDAEKPIDHRIKSGKYIKSKQ